MIFLIRMLVLAAVIWLAMKVGIALTQKMSNQKRCENCQGRGYWEGVRERNICKACSGTGLVDKTP